MSTSVTLYAAPMSSATPVVHALNELEVPHERVMLDLSEGEQRKAAFVALNPNGKVPTLVVDGTPLFEALAIIVWLGDRFGVQRGLWPVAEAPQRLEALSWTTWAYVTLGSALGRLNTAGSDHVPAALHHPPQVEFVLRELAQLLGILNDRLQTRPYLLGESFSLADLAVANMVIYATYCGVAVADEHAHVRGWMQRIEERPAFGQAWAPV